MNLKKLLGLQTAQEKVEEYKAMKNTAKASGPTWLPVQKS